MKMKPVPGFPMYEVTPDGRVWSHYNDKFLIPTRRGPYLNVDLAKDGLIHQRRIHVLVLEAFVGPRPDGMQCRHLNGDPHDNNLDNLRWGTALENAADRERHGRWPHGEKSPRSKLTSDDVASIRNSYIPQVVTLKMLAESYGVGISEIHRIIHKQAWCHL